MNEYVSTRRIRKIQNGNSNSLTPRYCHASWKFALASHHGLSCIGDWKRDLWEKINSATGYRQINQVTMYEALGFWPNFISTLFCRFHFCTVVPTVPFGIYLHQVINCGFYTKMSIIIWYYVRLFRLLYFFYLSSYNFSNINLFIKKSHKAFNIFSTSLYMTFLKLLFLNYESFPSPKKVKSHYIHYSCLFKMSLWSFFLTHIGIWK